MTNKESRQVELAVEFKRSLSERDAALSRVMNALSVVAFGLAGDFQLEDFRVMGSSALRLAEGIARTSGDSSEGRQVRSQSTSLLEAVACRLLEEPITTYEQFELRVVAMGDKNS